MHEHGGNFLALLIPRCFRRKTPPTPEAVRNVFEERMKQRLKKQRTQQARLPPVDEEFTTFDLLDARNRCVALKFAKTVTRQQEAPWLSWDSLEDTFVSPPSSAGAEAGGVIGTTHTNTPPDYDPGDSTQLTRQEVTKEAAFRLQQLANLDMNNATPSFAYQVPRPSERKWSMATTDGSVGGSQSK